MNGILGSLFGQSIQSQDQSQAFEQELRSAGPGAIIQAPSQSAMNQAMNAQAMSQQMAMRQQQIQADIYRSAFGDLYSEEEELRKNNPAVKDAWEQYQMTLRLAKK